MELYQSFILLYLCTFAYGSKDKDSSNLVTLGKSHNRMVNSGSSNDKPHFSTAQQKFRFIGISRRKPKLAAIRQEKVLSAPLLRNPKARQEGDFLLPPRKSKLHISKSFPSSNLLKQRFVPLLHQVEVSPSLIEQELPFDFADDRQNFATAPINFKNKKFADEAIKVTVPSKTDIFKGFIYPADLKNKPAFCRKCFKFWRSITQAAPNAALLQYCCTSGNGKRDLLKGFIDT